MPVIIGRGPREMVLPRIGTPRDPDCPTYGDQIGEVARRLGTPLMPHQQYAADVATEVDPDTGLLKYRWVVITVMRQSGKTVLVFAKKVWRLTVVPHRLGRQRALYTAQTRGKARQKLERDFVTLLRDAEATGAFHEIRNPKSRPSKSTRQWKCSLNNGQEHLLFGAGNYFVLDAPTRDAGHSDTIDDVTIDEAFAHQNDDVEQGVSPTQATRTDAQQWDLSTAGDDKSFYFWPKVRDGRATVEAGETSRVCYLEWSLPPEAELDDEDAWWEFMPALGRTISVEFIRAELDKARRSPDPNAEDLFRRGYCNQWVRIPVIAESGREQVISEATWKARRYNPKTSPVTGNAAFGVYVSPDSVSASIAVAGYNAEGQIQIEIPYFEQGTSWLELRLTESVQRSQPVAVGYDYGGPTRVYAPEIARATAGSTVNRLSGREWAASCEAFVQALEDGRVVHPDSPWLNSAVDGAGKKIVGIGWMWDELTSLADIAPLGAATAAVRALESFEPEETRELQPFVAVTD